MPLTNILISINFTRDLISQYTKPRAGKQLTDLAFYVLKFREFYSLDYMPNVQNDPCQLSNKEYLANKIHDVTDVVRGQTFLPRR